jgi:predicted Kef-type K+ transport protein
LVSCLHGLDWNTALLLAIALSFSSTVFSAKILEAKRDLGAFYGRTAIGILIVQDIIALVVLAHLGRADAHCLGPWDIRAACCVRRAALVARFHGP